MEDIRLDNTYFNMNNLAIIEEEPLHKEFSSSPSFNNEGASSFVNEEPELVIKVERKGRGGATKKAFVL